MSTSLRDQLLKAGLINKQQANEVERQHDRQQRQPQHRQPQQKQPPHKQSQHKQPQQKSTPQPVEQVAAVPTLKPLAQREQSAKVARDLALNRKQQEKALKKAQLAQTRQLIAQNKIAPAEHGDPYNFVDGTKIRRLYVDARIRMLLGTGEIVIVQHEGVYSLVSDAAAKRMHERDATLTVISGLTQAGVAAPEAAASSAAAPAIDDYQAFPVPDDLIW